MRMNVFFVLLNMLVFLVPVSGRFSIEQGNALYFEGKFSEAIRAYSGILTENIPGDDIPQAMFASARCYQMMGNQDMALKAYWQLVGDYPGSDWADNAFFELAKLRESEGSNRLGEALVLYETILARYPRSEKLAEAYLGAARVKVALNYFEFAHDTLQNALERLGSFEETASVHYDIATILAHPQNPKRDPRKAIEHLNIVTTRFPASDVNTKAIAYKAKLQWELGNRPAALELFRDITFRESGSPMAEYAQECMARIYEETGDLQRAVNAYRILQVKYSYSRETRKRIQADIDRFTAVPASLEKPSISAWSANEDKMKRRITYAGDVEVVLGETVFQADHAVADLAAGTIQATGNIRVRWMGSHLIYCDQIECNLREGYAVCQGNVVEQKKDSDGISSRQYARIRLSFSDSKLYPEEPVE